MAAPPTNSTSHPPPPPPPSTPPSSHSISNLPMLYYGLVVIGTAAIVLALYNLLIIRWCTESRRRTRLRMGDNSSFVSFRSSDSRSININLGVSSFRYKKEGVEVNECAVCLSAFEDGEEVRRLPKCNHSFHAPCIDMWLYSHMDCPLCRSPVEPPVLCRHKNTATEQVQGGNTSQEGLLVPGNASSIV